MNDNNLLDMLAQDMRPMLGEIARKFIPGNIQGWVGLLFDPGPNHDYIAFAEAVAENGVIQKAKKEVEDPVYIIPTDVSMFSNAFSNEPKSNYGKYCIDNTDVQAP